MRGSGIGVAARRDVARLRQFLHQLGRDVEIGPDLLDVVVLLEQLHQLHDLLGVLLGAELDRVGRLADELGALHRDLGRLEPLQDDVELLNGALEANLSLISVQQNEVTKKLASWAAILAVPTMIAGIYGMNFEVMPELKWAHGYPLIMGITFAACSVLFWRFKKSGWL